MSQKDFCDSCTLDGDCKIYKLDGELFVWCDDCADESASEVTPA